VNLTLETDSSAFSTPRLFVRLPKPEAVKAIGVQAVNSAGFSKVVFANNIPLGILYNTYLNFH